MRILDRSVYVGPSLYEHLPGDPASSWTWAHSRPGNRKAGRRVRRCTRRGAARPRRARLLVWRARRFLPAHARGRRHLARPRARARAIELQNVAARTSPSARRAAPADPACTRWCTKYAQRDEGIAAGELGLRLLGSLLPEAIRPADSVPEGWTWPEARDEFIRFGAAPRARPSTASLVKAAQERGIPVAALNDQSLVQLRPRSLPAALQATVTGRSARTSPSSSRATRRRPTRSSPRSACPCRARTRAERGPGRARSGGASASRS